MQYLAAYTLATLSGKEPSQQQLTAILNATGKPVDAAQVKAVVQKLKGKQIHDLISKGQSKVGSVGGGAPSGGAKAGKQQKKDDKKKQEKKEQKKPQPKKEEKKAPEPEPEQQNFDLDLFG